MGLALAVYADAWAVVDLAERPTMAGIRAEVAAAYGLDIERDIQGPSRQRHIAQARAEIAWRCRQVTWSDGSPRFRLQQIGAEIGIADHTSVLAAIQRHAVRIGEAAHG